MEILTVVAYHYGTLFLIGNWDGKLGIINIGVYRCTLALGINLSLKYY